MEGAVVPAMLIGAHECCAKLLHGGSFAQRRGWAFSTKAC